MDPNQHQRTFVHLHQRRLVSAAWGLYPFIDRLLTDDPRDFA